MVSKHPYPKKERPEEKQSIETTEALLRGNETIKILSRDGFVPPFVKKGGHAMHRPLIAVIIHMPAKPAGTATRVLPGIDYEPSRRGQKFRSTIHAATIGSFETVHTEP